MDAIHQNIIDQYNDINEKLNKTTDPKELSLLGKAQSRLISTVSKITDLYNKKEQLDANNKLLDGETDADLLLMINEDNSTLTAQIDKLTEDIELALLPRDEKDGNNIILEMRAGAGGDESSLFSAELFRAYSKYAEKNGFKMTMISHSKSDVGGFKEVIAEIKSNKNEDNGPYAHFKYESGVHRVQRVPETEKSGRVHTSTITVAIMPEIEEKDYQIDPKDLIIEATTSSGAGGQSVNTTYSAIRIVHIPTGIVATCQDERSQTQNKEKALAVIRARVSAHYEEIERQKITDARKNQIGTGDRSEKIRTYNFPQDRITDHRINQNFNQIALVLEGNLDPIITALQKADTELKKQNLAQK